MVAILVPFQTGLAQEVQDGFTLITANENLSLYLNDETTEVAVQHNGSQHVWYSNPTSSKTDKATLSIVYYNPSDEMLTMDNYKDSISYEQFKIHEISNGLRIDYLFGPEWVDDDYLPLMVPQERFENDMLPLVPSRDQRWFEGCFELIALEEVEPDFEYPTAVTEVPDLRALLNGYNIVSPGSKLNAKNWKTLVLLLVDTVVNAHPDLTARADIKFEHISQLVETPAYVIDNSIRPWDRTDIINIMRDNGYSPDEIAKDHIANNIEPPVRNVEVFNVSLEYILDGDGLVVRVPMDSVKYPHDVEPNKRYLTGVSGNFRPTNRTEVYDYFGQIGGALVTFPLYSISVLNNFGAVPSGNEGYLVLPDGSGALVDTSQPTSLQYARYVYGRDNSVRYGLDEHLYVEPADRYLREGLHMPIFGIKEGNKAIMGVIEDGQGMAMIRANTASNVIPFSKAWSEFIVMPYGNIPLQETDRTVELSRRARGSIKSFTQGLPEEDISIRYTFFVDGDANYVGMANHYREYLVERHDLVKNHTTEEDIPFYVELTGAVPVEKSFMGIPRIQMTALTDYNQAKEIVEQLLANSVDNIHLRYTGMFHGGLEPGFRSDFRLDTSLGNTKEFQEMVDFYNANNVGFYPDISFYTMYNNNYGKFHLKRDVAQSLDREPVTVFQNNNVETYVLSPTKLAERATNLISSYPSGVTGLSLADLGEQINSDFDRQRENPRGDSLRLVEDTFALLDNEYDLMVNKANTYTLSYADHLVNIPLTSNDYYIVARSIPFYQMAVHGYVDYAGSPFNAYPDLTAAVLKSVETGASPFFSWTYEPTTTVKGTKFDYLFPNYFASWFDTAVDTYHQMNDVLSVVQGLSMINHEELEDNVFKTTYENNLAVIVNYNREVVEYKGVVIEGESFKLIREGV